MKRTVSLALLCAALGTARSPASPAIVEGEDHHDASPPLWLIPPDAAPVAFHEHPVKPLPRLANGARPDETAAEPSFDVTPEPFIPTLLQNLLGVGVGFTGPAGTFSVTSAPPDTVGDVGPNHYVQVVNDGF